MSTRGIDFLDKWMSEHLPDVVTDDPIAISDLADRAMLAAGKAGVSEEEITEEVGSIFGVIADAMLNRDGALAD